MKSTSRLGTFFALLALGGALPVACSSSSSPALPGSGGSGGVASGGSGGSTPQPAAPARVVARLMLAQGKLALIGLHEVSPTAISVKHAIPPQLDWQFESDMGAVLASGKLTHPQLTKSEFGPSGKADPKSSIGGVGLFEVELPNTGGWFTLLVPASGPNPPMGPPPANPFSIFIQQLFNPEQTGSGGAAGDDSGAGAAASVGGTGAGGTSAPGSGGAPVGGSGGADAGPSVQVVEPSEPCTAYTFLLVAEGYTKSEESKFDADAQAMIAKLEAIPGFAENWKYVAVYRKFFTSVDSGLSDAATGTVKDTAFRVEHAHDPNDPAMHRQIWMRDDLPAETLAKLDAARTETHSDVVLMLANTSEWAGTASAQVRIGIFAANPDVARIAGHEIGHALWDLEDEYDYGTCNPDAYEPIGPNVALGSPYPWQALMTKGVQLPTTAEDKTTVGAYKGALYCPENVYRPQFSCFMRDAFDDFCKVCLAHVNKQFKERTAACQPKGSCNHSECAVGGALTQSCGACSSAICSLFPDCCDPAKGWTEECVAEAKKTVGICRGVCADGVSACAHDECTEGAALNESCSTCAAAVCERDSYCCSDTGKWDWICASEAERDPYCECP